MMESRIYFESECNVKEVVEHEWRVVFGSNVMKNE
jgi:hypothetical protein